MQKHSTDSGKQECPICSKKYDTHLQLSSHIEWCHNATLIQQLKDPNNRPQVKVTRLTAHEINAFMKKNPEKNSKALNEPNSSITPKTRRIPRQTQEDFVKFPKPVIKLTKMNPESLTSKLNKAKQCKVVLKRLNKTVLESMLLTKRKPETLPSNDEANVPEPVVTNLTISRRESWTCDTDLHKELRGFDELGIEHDDHSLVLASAEKLCPPEVLNLDNNNIKIKWMNGLLSNMARPRSDFKKTMTDILDKICPEVKPRNILYE